MTTQHTITLPPGLPLSYEETGSGQALVLHGGGGPVTVAPLTAHLAETMHVLAPVHPGWNRTPRPDRLASIPDLAAAYLDWLRERDLRDVLVTGSSLGGWIAAEMAAGDDEGRIGTLVLIDSAGIEVPGAPIRDFFALDPRGIAEYAWHDSERFYVDPATVPPEQAAVQAANTATMRVYAGDPYMHDPGLLARLGGITVPALVLWGDSDQIITPDYGRYLAGALGNARYQQISDAGHLPHLEQPAATLAAIDQFLAAA